MNDDKIACFCKYQMTSEPDPSHLPEGREVHLNHNISLIKDKKNALSEYPPAAQQRRF